MEKKCKKLYTPASKKCETKTSKKYPTEQGKKIKIKHNNSWRYLFTFHNTVYSCLLWLKPWGLFTKQNGNRCNALSIMMGSISTICVSDANPVCANIKISNLRRICWKDIINSMFPWDFFCCNTDPDPYF